LSNGDLIVRNSMLSPRTPASHSFSTTAKQPWFEAWAKSSLALQGVAADAGNLQRIAEYAMAHHSAWEVLASFPLPERVDAAAVFAADI